MTPFEQEFADFVRESVNHYSTTTERAEQDKQFIVGASQVGYCSERLRRQLDRQEPQDEVQWNKAFIGTAIGDYLERAALKSKPHILTEATIATRLDGDQRSYLIPGHSDYIDVHERLVIDFKAVDGLEWIRRKEVADQGYRFQRAIYGYGAWQAGMFGDCPVEEVRVGNCYYDRSGKEPTPHVEIENLSMDTIREATWWLDEVVEAYLRDEEAIKEPPRQVCETTCGFFSKCRMYDTDTQGVIRDPDQIGAIEMYRDGTSMISKGKKLQNEAKIILQGVEGSTADANVRWVQINGGPVSYNQESYMRLSITKRR